MLARRSAITLCAAVVLSACATMPTAQLPAAPTATPSPAPLDPAAPWRRAPPRPVNLPADEAPHDVLTEWWYYTGHLVTESGERYGYQFVVFQVALPAGGRRTIAHAAVTDPARGHFVVDQRTEPSARASMGATGFDLALGDWRMRGRDGHDRLQFGAGNYRLELSLLANRPPVLHDRVGYISFGAAGDSYYYSRTRQHVVGTLQVDGQATPVSGQGWFDKQWGDFVSGTSGGWDWFALQLDDGRDLMVFEIRDPGGRPLVRLGSLVTGDGQVRYLEPAEIQLSATERWRSPRTGVDYPVGWRVGVPSAGLDLTIQPLLPDQEVDARQTTGVIYWEGAVSVAGQAAGQPLGGRGYVELTGYGGR